MMDRFGPLSLVGVVVAAMFATGLSGAPADNAATFQDTTGEDPFTPDLSSVRVANDDFGRITFRVEPPNRPKLPDDLRFSVWIDADDNPQTGLSEPGLTGFDHRLLYDAVLHGDQTLWLLRCSATTCAGGSRTLALSYANGLIFTVDRAELADTRRFRFFVQAMDGIVYDPESRTFDLSNAHADRAPDSPGAWVFVPRIGPGRLLVERLSISPEQLRPGEMLTARLIAIRDDNGARVRDGRVSCAAGIDGRRAKLLGRTFAGAAARCVWRVPRGAEGRTVRGSIAIAALGKTVKASFVRPIAD